MKLWIFILISDLLVPLILVIAGYCMLIHTPKKINHFAGYRTSRSMKNMDTWLFANKTCGKLFLITGGILFLPSLLVHLPFLHSAENTLSLLCLGCVTVQVLSLIIPIVLTEKQLRARYDDQGNLK